MKNIPERIFLHLGDPDDLGDCKDFNELGGVSWADERISPNDVEYVRKDVSGQLPITDDERTFMQDCCIYPHYYYGKEIAAQILTEDSEGSFLDPDDLLRLSDVLYRYVKGNGG